MTVLTAQLARELIDSQGLYVIIPDIYTSIADRAFLDKQIIGVEIPESIVSIGEKAFQWTQLRSVVIPNSVTHIGANAFDGSYELRSIHIGSNVEFIGEEAFARTDNTGTGAESLVIPDSVKTIEKGAFYAMYNLKNVSIGSGITSIPDWAFTHCHLLDSITIPEGVVSIGMRAFGQTTLKEVVIPKSVTSIGKRAFSGTSLKEVVIPSSVKSLAADAFDSNVKLVYQDSGGSDSDVSPEDTIKSAISMTLPDGIKNLILTGKKNINGYGNSRKNRLTGNSGNNLLDGKGGADVMIGKKGNDTYIVNHAKDRVVEKVNSGNDTIKSSVNETLSANVENLVLLGKKNLKGYGNQSKNRLTGNSGKNVLDGKGGADVMRGKKGNDTYFVNHAKDRVVEKAKGGNDAVRSSIDHVLSKHVESLFLTGKKNLKGYGNRGNNYLTGNSGKNVLVGKAGRDTMSGLGGRDRFVYRSIKDSGVGKTKRDVITDFNGKKGEKIDLLALDANPKKQGNQSLSFIGSRSFSGNRGEVRFSSGILQVNTGSDKRSDMDIELKGVTFFSKSFLVL